MPRLNRDHIMNIPSRDSARAAMTVLNGMQHLRPHQQIIGITAVFKLMCEAFNLDPYDLFSAMEKIIRKDRIENRKPEFAAVEMYIENEL